MLYFKQNQEEYSLLSNNISTEAVDSEIKADIIKYVILKKMCEDKRSRVSNH